MGKFLSKRDIVKELGNNIWDDDNKTWIIAIKGDMVLGFCAFIPKKHKIEFCSDYVLPEYRNNKIYDKLFSIRLNLNKNKRCIAHASPKSLNTFIRYKFSKKYKKGKYIIVEK